MTYHHTQRSSLYLILCGVGVVMFIWAYATPLPLVKVVLIASGGLILVLAAGFRQLTVRDERDHLLVQFGPLPLFWRRVAYSNIQRAERGRTTIFDGWGIHLSSRGGWVWNLWGFDCVDLDLRRGRKLSVGTDDPEGLEALLSQRIREHPNG